MKILRVDSSSRLTGSHSRKLADQIQAKLEALNPGAQVKVRDLIKQPVPHIQNNTIEAFYVPPAKQDKAQKEAVALSDQLIAEILEADVLLLSVPIYNFSLPSALKAYFDQVVRVNQTFSMSDKGFEGLLKNKKAYVASSLGAVFTGTAISEIDFLNPYIKTILSFVGFDPVEFFTLEGSSTDQTVFAQTQTAVAQQIQAIT